MTEVEADYRLKERSIIWLTRYCFKRASTRSTAVPSRARILKDLCTKGNVHNDASHRYGRVTSKSGCIFFFVQQVLNTSKILTAPLNLITEALQHGAFQTHATEQTIFPAFCDSTPENHGIVVYVAHASRKDNAKRHEVCKWCYSVYVTRHRPQFSV